MSSYNLKNKQTIQISGLILQYCSATTLYRRLQFILCSNQDGNEDNVRRGVNDCKILNPPISGRWLYCPSVTTEIPETVSDWTIMEQQLLRDYDFCLLLWSNISFTISLLSFISKQRVVNRNPGDSKYSILCSQLVAGGETINLHGILANKPVLFRTW